MTKNSRKSKVQTQEHNLTEKEKQFLDLLAEIYVQSILKESAELKNMQQPKNQGSEI